MDTARPTPPARNDIVAGATDCHFHIYDESYPALPNAVLRPPPAPISEYRALQRRLGLTRAVIVQPSTYGTDNRLILDVVQALGPANTRAVAVVAEDIHDDELAQLHAGGVRGIRFNLSRPGGPGQDAIERLGRRVAKLGWHVQLNTSAQVLRELGPALLRPRDYFVVVDHMGHVPATALDGAEYQTLADLLRAGMTYVKLSGFYKVSAQGAPHYADAVQLARRLVEIAPDRMLWGSDWPHPTESAKGNAPDDATLFGLLADIAPDKATRARILVDNPARLYGF